METLPDEPHFAHPVEKALADVLDEHGIAWLYEPHTFPLERHGDGGLKAAFTPDFYLPELGMYIECTVARRRLTTAKRKKVERARHLHGITVEIVYRDDLERIAARWSLRRLARALHDAATEVVDTPPRAPVSQTA